MSALLKLNRFIDRLGGQGTGSVGHGSGGTVGAGN